MRDTYSHTMNRRYQDFVVVGRGTYGVVYKAYDNRVEKYVAIKKTRLPAYSEKQGANILKHLDCPNCPSYIDSFEDEHFFYLVTSYVEGRDLSHYPHSLNNRQSLHLACDMMKVLCSIWQMNVTFNDLKPSNILYDGKHFCLIDFGSVLPLGSHQIRFGSPAFASFELLNSEKVDWRSDLVSLSKTVDYVLNKHNFFFSIWFRKASTTKIEKRYKHQRSVLFSLWWWLYGCKVSLVLGLSLLFLFQPIRNQCYQRSLQKENYALALKIYPQKEQAYQLYFDSHDMNCFENWQLLLHLPIENVQNEDFLWQCANTLTQFLDEEAWKLQYQILEKLECKVRLDLINDPSLETLKKAQSEKRFIYDYGVVYHEILDEKSLHWLFEKVKTDADLDKNEKELYMAKFALFLNQPEILKEAFEMISQSAMEPYWQALVAYQIFENGEYDEGWLHEALRCLEKENQTMSTRVLKGKIDRKIKQWGKNA